MSSSDATACVGTRQTFSVQVALHNEQSACYLQLRFGALTTSPLQLLPLYLTGRPTGARASAKRLAGVQRFTVPAVPEAAGSCCTPAQPAGDRRSAGVARSAHTLR
jgi:hypothetical protein